MIFGTLNPEKISHEHITYLSDVATLPWEIQKNRFQQYHSYTSDDLHYLRKNQIATVLLQL